MIFSLGSAPPLDQVTTTAYVAYGLRKLRNSYTGAVLRIINSVNAQGDLSFDSNGEVSASSIVTITTAGTGFTLNSTYNLAAFANGGNVRVVTWYDQSGNGRHVTQSTAANRLFLMLSGNFNLVDNKPSLFKPRGFLGALTFTGAFASYYNLVDTYGPLNIVKYTANVTGSGFDFPNGQYFFKANQITLWGTQNYITDSSPHPPCTTTGALSAGYYLFGIGNQTASITFSFAARSAANVVETQVCSGGSTVTAPACTARSYLDGLGGTLAPGSIHNASSGTVGRIISTTDRFTGINASSPNGGITSYFNGTSVNYKGQVCGKNRWPFIDRIEVSQPTTFTIGSVLANTLRDSNTGELEGGNAADIDFAFQELIAFNGTGQHTERSIIEKNMGRYYNINVV
jgi:hypothetical protein